MKNYLLIVIIFIGTITANADDSIDYQKINSVKSSNVVAGEHLFALSLVYADISKNIPNLNLSNYIISTKESGNEIVVYLSKPFISPPAGGGSGKYVINMQTKQIVSKAFYK